MEENYLSIEAWAYGQDLPESLWITEENEALTKALQISFSDDSSSGSIPLPASETQPSSIFLEPPVLSSDPDSKLGRNPIPSSSSGKITKRKSRVSKRSPTTYITADAANFRHMVQQVTGFRFGEPSLPVEPVLKRDPLRDRALLQQSCLPTLDTSAYLLDRAGLLGPGSGGFGSIGPVVECSELSRPDPAFEFESLSSFPSLESWGII